MKMMTPTVGTVQVWPEGVDSALKKRFENTDWNTFAIQTTVLDCIKSKINSVTTFIRITTFPYQKPWISREV